MNTNEIILLAGMGLSFIAAAVAAGAALHTMSAAKQIARVLEKQYTLIAKLQMLLKTKSATNAVAENAEMIYQDLLQSLIPIMAAIDVMPRQTSEHPLWRALGGIMDEYAKNPFTLEKLRRAIKLNTEVTRSVEKYIARAEKLLTHLAATEPDGILSATFTDGLLGQSLTLFAQARGLATHEDMAGDDARGI